MSMSIYKADNGNFVEWLSRGLRPRSLYASIAIAKAIAGMVLFIPLGVFYSFLLFIILTNSGDNDKDMTYDDLKTRYSRVRHQLILQTQELNISKSDLKALVDSIHQLDDIIKGTQVFTPLYTSIVNFFSSTNKSAKENIALQKVMETLTNNELFVKSAQLRTL